MNEFDNGAYAVLEKQGTLQNTYCARRSVPTTKSLRLIKSLRFFGVFYIPSNRYVFFGSIFNSGFDIFSIYRRRETDIKPIRKSNKSQKIENFVLFLFLLVRCSACHQIVTSFYCFLGFFVLRTKCSFLKSLRFSEMIIVTIWWHALHRTNS